MELENIVDKKIIDCGVIWGNHMTEKKLYTCDICKTDYASKEKAIQCEKNHKLLETATIVGVYTSMSSIKEGVPAKIRVKFKGMDKFIEYERF